jgi:glucans biosynthesis protein C
MRNHALDTARVLAMVFVVAAHAAMAYMVTPIGWAIQDPWRSLAADLFVWIARSMVMPLFFWLAGYFSSAVYERAGAIGFLRQRATRIALPLVVAVVPMSFALDALWDWGREIAARQGVPPHIPAMQGSELPITLGHLWFLYYLLAMSALALVLAPIGKRYAIRVPALVAGVVSIVPLVITGRLGLDTPFGFAIDPAVLVYEGAFFAWGWLVHRDPVELDHAARRVWLALAGAAALLGVLIRALQTGDTRLHVILCSGAFSLLLVDGALGLCVRYGSRPSRGIRAVSDASYLVYIIHVPIVVALQILIASRS